MHVIARFLLSVSLVSVIVAGESQDPLPFPDMAPSVGAVLDKYYYDASRFRPRLMVERALRMLEQSEIGIDTTWSGDRIVLNLRGERLTVDAPEPANLDAAMQVVESVRVAIDKHFDAPADRLRDLAYAEINGVLSTLDPHTVMWPPEAAREWSEDNIQGQFYGIGAFLNQDEGLISIQRVMPGLPAERAGVEDGDVILAIDGEKTAGLTLDQAVRRIKGPKGTTVGLSLERKGLKAPVEVPIVRDLVKVITIRNYRDGDVGYVRMDEFNANTAHDLFLALRELERETPIKALVLDLRFNGGGLLDQAKLIGGFFLARGQEVVRTTTVDGKQDVFDNNARRFVTAPMVVLTSPGTASAAEIVSGALQLNERAVIAGETTFGKGSVQNIRELRDGSRLKLTIQEYLLPGGVSIQDVGVMPDLVLARHSVRQDGSVDLRDMSMQRERDNEFALGSRKNYVHDQFAELGWLDPWMDREARRVNAISARDFRPDRQSQVVIDLLKTASAADDWQEASAKALAAETLRQFLLERLAAPLAARAEVEAAALADALARLPQPVRWGAAGLPAAGSLAITWTGPATVAAGETVALSVQVDNHGQTDAGRLFAIIRADPRSPFWEEEFVVGQVAAGSSASGMLHFQVPPRLPTGLERFTVELHQDGGKTPLATCDVEVGIAAKPAPHLGLAWKVVESSGDGRLATEERAELQIEVINDGTGSFDAGAVWVEKDNDPYVSLNASRQKIELPVAPGASTTLSFPLTVRKEVKRGGKMVPFTADRIKLNVAAVEIMPDGIDARFRADVRAAIEIPIGQPLKPRRLIQPMITLDGTQAEGGRTRLQFSISDVADDEQAPVLDLVALFQDEDKVDLQTASALDGPPKGPWIYTPRIQLKPGLNQLRLLVKDGDGVVADHFLRLWGPKVVAEADAAAAPVAPPQP
jgi:carboxyl-terminal processing protease